MFYGLLGRGLRYFVPCGLFYFFGPVAGEFIEKHKKWAGIGMLVLVVIGFAMAPLLFPKTPDVTDLTPNHAVIEDVNPEG